MLRVANILVVVDPARPCLVLPQALRWAHRLQATVHAVEVHVAGGDSAPPHYLRARPSDRMRQAVRACSQRLRLPAVPPLHALTMEAPSLAQGAIQYAGAHDIDLIVGAPPPHELPPLIGQTDLPLHLVGTAEAPEAPLQRVLVPIDFSRHALRSLAHGRLLAARFGADLHVLHVLERPPYVALNSTDMLALSDAKLPERRARRRADALFARTEGPSVKTHVHVAHGDPAREIEALAGPHSSSLLVLSSHGSTGQADHPVGTTTEKLVRRLSTPIFLLQSFGTSLVTPASGSATPNP